MAGLARNRFAGDSRVRDDLPVSLPPENQLIDTIERFYLRARRVAEHSLFDNQPALEAVADGAWWATQKDGNVTLSQSLPAEEALESLAARVRPLILNDDPVFFDKAINAISTLLHLGGHLDHVDWCKKLKADWKAVNPKNGKASYSISWSTQDGSEVPQEITDAALALSWFYGDLVHANSDQQDIGEKFGLTQRYAAAAVRTAQLAILTRDTLGFVRSLADLGVLPIDVEQLDQRPVGVNDTEYAEASVMTAPPGTVAAPAGQPQNPLFTQLEGAWLGEEDGTRRMIIPWAADD